MIKTESRDLIKETKELNILDVKFSGEGNIIKATENLYDSIRRLDNENTDIKNFINS